MTERRLGILQVSTFDAFGGAARVAWNLFQAYRTLGHDSWLAVGEAGTDDPDVFRVPVDDSLSRLPRTLAKAVEYQLGIEDFRFPDSHRILDLPPRRPDIVHAHNLHGGYFDLGALRWLSRELPVFLTLHDAWLLSGHCGHSLDCERWRIGCGHCPDLTLDPAVVRDATAYNWRRKAAIYRDSRLHVATPSRWLMERVEQSMLADAIVDARVVPNGVDTAVFHPGDAKAARHALGIPPEASVVLFAANALRHNVWKDYRMARAAIARTAESQPVLFIALGDDAPPERLGSAEVRFVPFEHDPRIVASWFRAADAYVHASRADTFPNTILEALASGTPVVATAVGGIPEQIEHGRTGFLVPPGDADAMAGWLVRLLADPALRVRMGGEAAAVARSRFGIERQVDAYVDWYGAALDFWRQPPAADRRHVVGRA
jgi:glycosyltransferase involved in cell wall biosynthesis